MREHFHALAKLPQWVWLVLVSASFAGCSATSGDVSALGANLPGFIAALVAIVQVYNEKAKVAKMLAEAEVSQKLIQQEQERALLHTLDLRNSEVTELKRLVDDAIMREHDCVTKLQEAQEQFRMLLRGTP